MKIIWLTRGQFTLVDNEDYDFLNQWKWNCHKQRNGSLRVVRRGDNQNNTTIIMAREILGAKEGEFIDHIDRNPLNNQRYNLRLCTQHQNNFNKTSAKNSTSKYLGVCLPTKYPKWTASITFNYRHIHIGRFDNEIEAAIAYNKKAIELFGEFANLNNV